MQFMEERARDDAEDATTTVDSIECAILIFAEDVCTRMQSLLDSRYIIK